MAKNKRTADIKGGRAVRNLISNKEMSAPKSGGKDIVRGADVAPVNKTIANIIQSNRDITQKKAENVLTPIQVKEIDQTANEVRRIKVDVDILNFNVNSLMNDSQKSLGMIQDLVKFNEYAKKKLEGIEKKQEEDKAPQDSMLDKILDAVSLFPEARKTARTAQAAKTAVQVERAAASGVSAAAQGAEAGTGLLGRAWGGIKSGASAVGGAAMRGLGAAASFAGGVTMSGIKMLDPKLAAGIEKLGSKALSGEMLTRFMAFLEKKGAKALVQKVVSKVGLIAAGAAVPAAGWIFSLVSAGLLIADAHELVTFLLDFIRSEGSPDDKAVAAASGTGPQASQAIRDTEKMAKGQAESGGGTPFAPGKPPSPVRESRPPAVKYGPGGAGAPGGGATGDVKSFGSLTELIKNYEGFIPKAKWDYQQYSNGYGTKALSPDEEITKEEAEKRLNLKIGEFRSIVENFGKQYKYDWNENQINALTSFVYNLGPGALSQVTANGTRKNEEIAMNMLEYNKAGGTSLAGLTQRRKSEAEMFNRGVGAKLSGQDQAATGVAPPKMDIGGSLETQPSSMAAQVTGNVLAGGGAPPPTSADFQRASAPAAGGTSGGYQYPGKESGPAPGGTAAETDKKPENVRLESDRVNLSRVDKDLLSSFYAAAKEYGRPVTIASAHRDDAYQAELWARGSLGEKGIHTPAKPKRAQRVTIKNGPFVGRTVDVPGGGTGSSHSDGRAIDSPTTSDPMFLSILQKHGLTTPFGASDPVHVQKKGDSLGGSGGGGSGGGYVPSPPQAGSMAQGAPQGMMSPPGRPAGQYAPQGMLNPNMTSRAQVPGPMGIATGLPGMGPLAGILSSIGTGGGRGLSGSVGNIGSLVGGLLGMLGGQSNRASNPSFMPDRYQNNNVPAAMPSSNLLRELFDLNMSPGYNPAGYAFGR